MIVTRGFGNDHLIITRGFGTITLADLFIKIVRLIATEAFPMRFWVKDSV
jgi:hypothetical protein